MDNKDTRLREAVINYKGIWPEELISGVMFWRGLRIDVFEFSNCADAVYKIKDHPRASFIPMP